MKRGFEWYAETYTLSVTMLKNCAGRKNFLLIGIRNSHNFAAPKPDNNLNDFFIELIFLTHARLPRLTASSDLDAVFCSSSDFLRSTSPFVNLVEAAINGAEIQWQTWKIFGGSLKSFLNNRAQFFYVLWVSYCCQQVDTPSLPNIQPINYVIYSLNRHYITMDTR